MHGKVRVIKRGSSSSIKREEAQKVRPKDNFRDWVAEWQSDAASAKGNSLPSLKDLFPSQGSYGKPNTTSGSVDA
jgi:hypothetical protein